MSGVLEGLLWSARYFGVFGPAFGAFLCEGVRKIPFLVA
jgi:hypothetical protein